MKFLLHQKLRPYAEHLDCLQELNHLITMAERPSGAERQLQLYDQYNGDLRHVVREGLLNPPLLPAHNR